nr:very short patch repair endonuclease [Mycobacterium intracellulare]
MRFPAPMSEAVRSRMARQPRLGTRPELEIRRLLHAHGLRYRVGLRVPELPRRTIDVAFTRRKVAVFVDGCFWHGCPDHGNRPTFNATAWSTKLLKNRERDAATTAHLTELGWRVIRVWEHESPQAAVETIIAAVRG